MDELLKKMLERSKLTPEELSTIFNFVVLSAEAYENVKSAMSEEELKAHEAMKAIADKLRATASRVEHTGGNYFAGET